MNTIFCNCCKKNKCKDQYPKDKSKSDGLHSNCKQCKSKQHKIWKEQNREEYLRKKREYQQNHKDKENLKKITPRKILALWLVVSLVLTILAPKIFDLKDYKTDQILFTVLIVNFILMLLIVYLAKTLKGSGKIK